MISSALGGERFRHFDAPCHLSADGSVRRVETQHRLQTHEKLMAVLRLPALLHAVGMRVKMERCGGADPKSMSVLSDLFFLSFLLFWSCPAWKGRAFLFKK